MRGLELFCGVGGFAAAAAGTGLEVVGALDQSPAALSVYRLNFPAHGARQTDLEKIGAADLTDYRADFWWLSPPCQPYCIRGGKKDLADQRARSFLRIMEILATMPEPTLPRHLALENVEGFLGSEARTSLLRILGARGYELRELTLCPTELGVPSRRPRYYLAASREALAAPAVPSRSFPPLRAYLDVSEPDEELILTDELLTKFGPGLRILDSADPEAYTTCFTSSYGKSLMHSGSYLRHGDGARRFSPAEIARFLHFPDEFRFPRGMSLRNRWRLIGNSLSVAAVREVLRFFPGLTI